MSYSLVWWDKSPDTWGNDTKTGIAPTFEGEVDLNTVHEESVSFTGVITSTHGNVKYSIYVNNKLLEEQASYISAPIHIDVLINNEDMNIGINLVKVIMETSESPAVIKNVLINKMALRLKQNYGLVHWDRTPDTWGHELMPLIERALISNNGGYKTHSSDDGWFSISSNPSEQDYISYGMGLKYLSELTQEEWNQLDGDRSLSFYTEDENKTQVLIETETEPYSLYDEFGETMEVLYYTDDPDKGEAELEITANYSPLDEIEGDFEVVTWTDETDTERTLHMNAVPKPQFIKQVSPTTISGALSQFKIEEEESNGRYLFSSDKNTWRKWNGNSFASVSAEDVQKIGMTSDEVASITDEQWQKWSGQDIYLGVFLDEDVQVKTITYGDISPQESTELSDARLYILNTVSTIDVDFVGTTLTGSIDDEDQGRVQYRVILNGEPFYPKDGSFTELMPSPLNVNLTLTNKDYLIDEPNTLRVEFRDFWGTMDYWQQNFIGTYSGLLFSDTTGDYYSTDIGEVLKYLDFGVIIAGQSTIEHEVRLKNTYGYTVENIRIYAKDGDFPAGMKAQFGTNLSSFEALDSLQLEGKMKDGDETSFYIRLSTQLGVTPPTSGSFDIVVVADREGTV